MASSSDRAREQIVEILGISLFHTKELKESLQDERDALDNQDMEALMRATEAKGIQIRELQLLDSQRSRLCTDSGFAPGDEQMKAFVDSCDEDGEVSHAWDSLLDMAQECSDLNAVNGAIIRVRRQQVETGLSVLRGMPPSADTYSRDGENRDGRGNRSIAEA